MYILGYIYLVELSHGINIIKVPVEDETERVFKVATNDQGENIIGMGPYVNKRVNKADPRVCYTLQEAVEKAAGLIEAKMTEHQLEIDRLSALFDKVHSIELRGDDK